MPYHRLLWLRSTALCLALLACLPGPAQAERYRLQPPEELHAQEIGRVGSRVHLLTAAGQERTLQLGQIASVESGHPLPPRLRAKLRRARKAFLKEHTRALKRALKRWKRAKPSERSQRELLLARAPHAAQSQVFGSALKERRADVRSLALRRLSKLPGRHGVFPLVRAALTSKVKALPAQAHAKAYARHPSLTRRTYEAVAASQTQPARRLKALSYLSAIRDRASVDPLIGVLEKVDFLLRTQFAKGNLRRTNVNLGSRGGAAVNAPIELPETNLINVQTKVRAPTLRLIASKTGETLKTITGQSFGSDAKAWRAWWSKQPKPSPRTGQ